VFKEAGPAWGKRCTQEKLPPEQPNGDLITGGTAADEVAAPGKGENPGKPVL